MTSAKEMFKELDYEQLDLSNTSKSDKYKPIGYIFEDGSYTRVITFNQIMKRVRLKDTNDYTVSDVTERDTRLIKKEITFSIEELNAINQQVKELGWND